MQGNMADNSKFTDQELATLLREGNEAAFTEIYHRYKRLLYIHAYQRLRNEQEVDDIIHELFTALWDKRESLVFKTNLAGYLYTSVRNRIIDFISHKEIETRYIASLQNFIDRGENFTDFLLRERQLNLLIEKEIALLPPRMREVFELSRGRGYSHKEIAARLEISEKTVKSQINNALKILRVKLGIFVWLYLVTLY